MNKLFDKNLVFDEEQHKYTLLTNPSLEFTSTTTFIHNFFSKFDADVVANNLVKNVPKYRGMKVEDLKQDWKKSADDGTTTHKELERYVLSRRTRPKTPKGKQGVLWVKDNIINKEWEVYPEVTLYSEKYKISGTIDLLIYNPALDSYVLADWKTNKRIWKKSFNGKMGIKNSIFGTKYQVQLKGNIVYTNQEPTDSTTIINSIKERL